MLLLNSFLGDPVIMSKSSKSRKERVPKMTEEQYAEYVMAMKDETPVKGYREISSGRHDTPHLDAEGHKR